MLSRAKNEFISCSAVLSEDVANIIMPLYVITSSGHTSVWLLRPWQKETAATSDQWSRGKRAPRTGRWESGVMKESQSWYENIRPVGLQSLHVYRRTDVLLMGKPRLQDSKKHWKKRAQSATPLMTSHWITIWKGQTTSHIDWSTTICLLLLAMVGNSWMVSADQFATLSCCYLNRSHLVTNSNNESSCSSLVTMTVTFLTQPIQMSSQWGNDNHWTQPSHSTIRTIIYKKTASNLFSVV